MSDCDDSCELPRAYNNNQSPMLSLTSYHGSRRSSSRATLLQSEPISPPISADVSPCLPPEEEMSTVRNSQNQFPLTSEIVRCSQYDTDNGNNRNVEIGPSFPSFSSGNDRNSEVGPSFPGFSSGNNRNVEVGPSFPSFSSGNNRNNDVGPSFPGFSNNWPNLRLLQNPNKSDKEMEVIQEVMTEGLIKYGLPISAAAVAGTFLMRRRYKQFKATPVESFLLSALHYYGAMSLGLYTGLSLYTPEFEAKIKEKIPDSTVARALKENQDRFKSK